MVAPFAVGVGGVYVDSGWEQVKSLLPITE